MSQRIRNPFLDDVFQPDAGGGASVAVPLYDGVLDRIVAEVPGVDGEAGGARVVLLLAPRAGFGKSHLLAEVSRRVEGNATVVPLVFNPDCELTWTALFEQVLTAYEGAAEGEAAGDGLTRLDVAVRYLLGLANRRLIDAGVVPCGNRWEADSALARDYVKLFDFADERQVVARWFGSNAHKLIPLAAGAIGDEAGLRSDDCERWLRTLCAYAEGIGDPGARRRESLRWAVHQDVGGGAAVGGMEIATAAEGGEAGAKRRVREFCRLLSLHRPMVFVLDHLDGFYADGAAGRKVAYFVSEIQRWLPREMTVLSLNEDLWESSFKGGLPSAFEDRLTGNVVNLSGIDCEGGVALVKARLEGGGVGRERAEEFLTYLRLEDYFRGQSGKLVSPRVVLRYAAMHWDLFSAGAPIAGGGDPRPGAVEAISEGGGIDPFLLDPEASEPEATGDRDDAEPADGGLVLGGEMQGVIAGAADGLVDAAAGDTSEEAGEADGDGEDPFQRLKGMLLKLREERAAQGGEVESADADGEAPVEAPSMEEVEAAAEASLDEAIVRAFVDARKRFEGALGSSGAGDGAIDAQKVRNLVKIAGRRFPVVRYDEFQLDSEHGGDVAKWAYGGNEIYFGFEGEDREDYWRRLAEFVASRTGLHGGGDALRAKIVAFSNRDGGDRFPSIRNGDTPWDVIRLEDGALASLYAVDELICKAESGELEAEPGQVLGVLASQLDFFWRRVTRPKAAASAGEA